MATFANTDDSSGSLALFPELNRVNREDLAFVSIDGPTFSFENALNESIQRHLKPKNDPFSAGGLFSLSPLSTPSSSRSPSPEPTLPAAPGVTQSPNSPAVHPVVASKSRDKKNSRANRKRKRTSQKDSDQGRQLGANKRKTFRAKHFNEGPSIQTNLRTEALPVTSAGFVAKGGPTSKRVYKAEELLTGKVPFKLIEWDGRTATAITDCHGRVIAVLAGRPDDPSWESVHLEGVELLEATRPLLTLEKGSKKHRRGHFTALAYGISHGGGQTYPANLRQDGNNEEHMSKVVHHESFERFAGFGSDVLATWYPEVHAYCDQHLNAAVKNDPRLVRNYENSVFASATVNFGPRTQCFQHTDSANLPFGLCAITSLGSFDPKKGGHLVLWECGLVIELPAGSTVLIPSAVISHSNTAIAADERRYSFTQYSAGSLFRWVQHGFQLDKEYYAGLSDEEVEKSLQSDATRWEEGLRMHPKLKDIRSDK